MATLLALSLAGLLAMPQSPAADPPPDPETERPAAPQAALAGPVLDEAGTPFGGEPEPPPSLAQRPDFLFGPPRATVGVRTGIRRARAGSAFYRDMTDVLTLNRGDFDGTSLGADLAIRVARRADVVFGVEYASARQDSEYRDLVEDDGTPDGAPIRQTTRLKHLPLTVSGKYYFTQRGRSIGQFAWIPARFAPYAGAGGGLLWYRLRQVGDFVDFRDDAIFEGDLRSSGWTPSGHLFAGADFRLGTRSVVTAEARHTWASADMDFDYRDYGRIDLAGLQFTVGLQWRL